MTAKKRLTKLEKDAKAYEKRQNDKYNKKLDKMMKDNKRVEKILKPKQWKE